MKTNIGIEPAHTKKIVNILIHYLADSYTLYFKTHGYHWNVTGPYFYSVHKLFEDQYSALFESLDNIAERIRSIGDFVPATFLKFKELSSIQENHSPTLTSEEMIHILLTDHETIIRQLRIWIGEINQLDDPGTSDFLTSRIEDHEKMAWMLRSHL